VNLWRCESPHRALIVGVYSAMDLDLKKALQQEVLAAKARWGAAIKLSKGPSSSPTAPLPIGRRQQTHEQASSCDVD